MPLDKAIEYRKEHRKPYYGSKAIDKTCRNHGTCEICEGNRLYKTIKRKQAQADKLKEFKMSRLEGFTEE